jgi:hypothetical protein
MNEELKTGDTVWYHRYRDMPAYREGPYQVGKIDLCPQGLSPAGKWVWLVGMAVLETTAAHVPITSLEKIV